MGLGGGGTSYITGYNALFINPANLHLREKDYRVQFSFLESGFHLDTPLKIRHTGDRIEELSRLYDLPDAGQFTLNESRRESILSRHFNNERTSRQLTSVYNLNWFGIKWFGKDRSYGLALRSRQGSRYTVGRGFYDSTPIESGGQQQVNRSLTHDFQTLHELSFGYGESFTFLSGLFPRISRFVIGIAPKVVLSGPMYSTKFTNVYHRDDDTSAWERSSSYRYESSGVFSQAAGRLIAGRDPFDTANEIDLLSDVMNPTGVGAAIDLGLTYIYTFGDDLSLLRREDESTQKSLRLSLSVTDLGFVHFFDAPFRTETETSEPVNEEPPPLSDSYYAGALLQDFQFLRQNGAHPLQNTSLPDRDNFQKLLPTALQSGALFQINRVKVTGEFRLGFSNNAFQSTKFITFLGTEIRPLPFFPIRAGTRLAAGLPGYYSFGAGLETRYFDLNAAMQFRSTASGPTTEPVGASVVALKFYIP
jgi:hypothetical protein